MDPQFFTKLFPMSGPQPKTYNYGNVKRWMRQHKLTELDLIIIPINDVQIKTKHWILAVIDLRTIEIKFYDSMGGKHTAYMDIIEQYIQDETETQNILSLIGRKWNKIFCIFCTPPTIPRQTDSTSCALFVAANADCISAGKEPTGFRQQDMLEFRKQLLNLFQTHSLVKQTPA